MIRMLAVDANLYWLDQKIGGYIIVFRIYNIASYELDDLSRYLQQLAVVSLLAGGSIDSQPNYCKRTKDHKINGPGSAKNLSHFSYLNVKCSFLGLRMFTKLQQYELLSVLTELGYVLCTFAMGLLLHAIINTAGI